MNNLLEIGNAIRTYNRFALFTHVNADGDAIGSILGLGFSLKNLGKEVAYFVPEPVPQKFSFLKDFDLINKQSLEGFEVAILLDAAGSGRVEELEAHLNDFKLIINIDHHSSNGHFGNMNYVDGNAPSTTSVIYRLIEVNHFYINEDISNALFTGLMTDTGSFHYANTNVEAFEVAKELVKNGANPDYLGKMIYEQEPLPRMHTLGLALTRLVTEEFFAYSYITREDLNNLSATDEDTEGIVDSIRKVKNTLLVLLFKETSKGDIRVSLRGKDGLNVNKIAAFFGGGGHPQAAGCTLKPPLEEAIKIMIEYIKEQRK